jgi:tetratricopeptide (TPR) repeat protein
LTSHWPQWGDAWLGRGGALWHCDPEGAVAALRRAIELLPGEPRPRSALAGVLFDSGREQEALVEMRSLIADHPGYARGHFRLGHALMQKGDAAGSLPHLRRAVELDGRDPASLHWWLMALLRTGAEAEAAERATAATKAWPLHPVLWCDLAWARWRQGDAAAALAAAVRSTQLDAGNADAWTVLARAQAQDRDFTAARQSFERRVQALPAGEAQLQAREELIRFVLRPAPGEPTLDSAAAIAMARALDSDTGQQRPTARHLLALALVQDGREAEAKPVVDAALAMIAAGTPCPPDIQQALASIKATFTH